MAKRSKIVSKKYPENYIDWIDSIYVESKTLNKQLEFNELMMFITCLDDEMYEYNLNTIAHYIDFAFQDEHYLFLSLIKNYNEEPTGNSAYTPDLSGILSDLLTINVNEL